MRVTEALLRQNNQNKNKVRYDEDDEPTQRYAEKKLEWWSLNQNKTAFDSPMSNGLNTGNSVFDQKAVFRTNIERE